MKTMVKIVAAGLAVAVVVSLSGCASDGTVSKQAIGTGTGAALGAGVGTVLGNQFHNRMGGALLGAAVGGLAGNVMGAQADTQDRQGAQIRDLQERASTQVIYITNSNGSRSSVVIRQGPNGSWLGPRGEIYDTMPTELQLKSVYGF